MLLGPIKLHYAKNNSYRQFWVKFGLFLYIPLIVFSLQASHSSLYHNIPHNNLVLQFAFTTNVTEVSVFADLERNKTKSQLHLFPIYCICHCCDIILITDSENKGTEKKEEARSGSIA